ncbi:MAG: InlB B-repeat-containing protein [Rhodocyclaceae bacterium]
MLSACGSNDDSNDSNTPVTPAVKRTVSYDNEGTVTKVQVEDGAALTAPARPDKGKSSYFVGWFIDDGKAGHMWDFTHEAVASDVTLKAKFVDLSATSVVVDAYLAEASRGAFTFKTLQELKAANIADGTTVNFTPGVYWTDDYKNPAIANTPDLPGLIGISFPQSGLVFKGLTSNADDVRIAGNRGQTMGANGNWNVIGVGTSFSAYNLTIANYTSVDLVFPRDPSQNLARRTDARVQAQTITVAEGAKDALDKMYFENVRFVSFLNVLNGFQPARAYFKDSYFQLTDDSIARGDINVFEHCTFDFYGSHPSGSASNTIAALFNSTFNLLNDNPTFWFSKNIGGNWVLVDNVFKGPKEEIRWENAQRPDVTHFVYNNVYEDGTPVVFDTQNPQATATLSANALQIFKSGAQYNVYNLLKGKDGWNPSAQQQKYESAFKFALAANATTVQSDNAANEVIITPSSAPANAFTFQELSFDYDTALFTPLDNAGDGKLHLRAKLNATGRIIDTTVKALAPNGLVAHIVLHINPETVAAPVVAGTPSITIGQNLAALKIAYDQASFTDASTITWFRGSAPNDKAVQVAVTTLGEPYKNYQLSAGDVGQYLTAVITPKYEFSPPAANSIEVTTPRAIASADVAHPQAFTTDFANISWVGHTLGQPNVWYADTIKPSDVNQSWTPATTDPWAYAVSDREGITGVRGLRTATQGARLLYQPEGVFSDMSLSLDLTPEKLAGQGFGSATDQYLEVYLKWDPVTQTGYALRFQRLASDPLNGNKPIPSSGNSVRVSMIEYANGVRTVLPNSYVESSVYMPGAHVLFKLTGNVLTADVTTDSAQTNTQVGYSLPNEIHFSATLPNVTSTAGGFGMQFTGTASAGNRTQLQKLEVRLTPR